MPYHIVKKTLRALKSINKDVKNVKVSVLGTAYKANVNDSRLSPAEPIIRRLLHLGIKVTAYDPYCKESFGAEMVNSLSEAVRTHDVLIIVTDHTEFKRIDLQWLKSEAKEDVIIIDTKGVFDPNTVKLFGFKYYD
jgi:UDP-N-acetyl-D-mannosaminuronic acid dehydrogenase